MQLDFELEPNCTLADRTCKLHIDYNYILRVHCCLRYAHVMHMTQEWKLMIYTLKYELSSMIFGKVETTDRQTNCDVYETMHRASCTGWLKNLMISK